MFPGADVVLRSLFAAVCEVVGWVAVDVAGVCELLATGPDEQQAQIADMANSKSLTPLFMSPILAYDACCIFPPAQWHISI
jgi:hypothetical protein